MSTSASIFSPENIAQARKAVRALELREGDAPPPEDQRFHEAAAVLAWFEVNPTLQPVGGDAARDTAALELLVRDSICWYERAGRRRWTLKNDIRKQVLARLATREGIRAALAANPARPTDVLQRVFESLIAGKAKPLDQMSAEEMSATLQVLDWLEGTRVDGLPDAAEVRRRLELAHLREPFLALAGEHFRGRKRELAVLHDYVGVLPASSRLAAVARGLRRILSLDEKPPLLIHGPGGMGKSTLVARFILDHTAPDVAPIPFVYLDFDRPGLLWDEPLTLLIEAVRQLALQFPARARTAQRLAAEWQGRFASAGSAPRSVRFRKPSIEQFGFFIRDLELGDAPLLLVLDTFEEVQYRSRDFVDELWDFLSELQAVVPRTRTVIAGRAAITGKKFRTEPLPLNTLDDDAALGFLESLGIADAEVGKPLVSALGGNPLSLKLAAEVLRQEGPAVEDLVQELKAARGKGKIDDELIQGQLYRRILRRVHDEDVRKLAHPGLILRRITPALIEEVLARPCGVDISEPGRVQWLFDELRREVSLVTPSTQAAGPRELRHRPDVRRVMLGPLTKDPAEMDRVREIQQLAVGYYEGLSRVEDRAEEIYHRLLLGQPAETVGTRWMEGVEPYLRSAIDELAGAARSYLASRLGVELDAHRWEDEPLETWEPYAEKRARDLISLERFEEALEVLHRRAARLPESPLYLLEATALERVGRLREALQVAREAASHMAGTPNPALLDLHLVAARILEQLQEEPLPPRELAAALERLGRDFADARVVMLGLHFARAISRGPVEEQAPARAKVSRVILDVLGRIPDPSATVTPGMLRALISDGLLTEAELPSRLRVLVATGGVPQDPGGPPLEGVSNDSAVAGALLRGADGALADRGRFAELLKRVVTNRAELALIVRNALGIDLSTIGNPKDSVSVTIDRLVSGTAAKGRFGELALALYREHPDSPEVRELIDQSRRAARYDPPTPFDTCLVSGDRPFVGREALRSFLRSLHTSRNAVHAVQGRRGSGKSYSMHLVRYVQAILQTFDWALVDAGDEMMHRLDPHKVAHRIADQLDWNPQSLPALRDTGSVGRYVHEVADWLVGQGRQRGKPVLLIFDGFDSPEVHPQTVEMIRVLVSRATMAPYYGIRIALLGPPELSHSTDGILTVEALGPLTPDDVGQFFASVRQHLRKPVDIHEVDRLTTAALLEVDETPEKPSYNRELNEVLCRAARQLILAESDHGPVGA